MGKNRTSQKTENASQIIPLISAFVSDFAGVTSSIMALSFSILSVAFVILFHLPSFTHKIAVRDRFVFSWKPDFLGEVVEKPTWLDVAVIANEAIVESEAEHQDLQGVEEIGRMTGGGDAIYDLVLTSWSAR